MARDDSSSEPGPRLGQLLLVLLLMAGWAALLLFAIAQPPGVGAVSLWEMRSLPGARASAGRVLAALTLDALRFAPFGLLAVFAFRDRAIGLLRALLVAFPAFVMGLAASSFTLWLRARSTGAPGFSDLLLPATGVALGVLVGLAWRRGLVALITLPVKIAAALLLAGIVLLGLLLSALEPGPALAEPGEVGTTDRRELVALFRGKDPREIPPGETRTLRLANHDMERLVAWGLPFVVDPSRARADVRAAGGGVLRVRGGLRLPLLGRWLNVDASARTGVEQGRLWLERPRLRLGSREVPATVLDPLAPVIALLRRGERRLRPALDTLREVRVEGDSVTATYGRMSAPRGLVASLVWGEGGSEALREPVADQLAAVRQALERAPAGDARTARAFEAAFALARQRSTASPAVEENRAAILALAIALGSGRLTPFIGEVASADQRRELAALRRSATLHGRADWTRHFTISGALTLLSDVAPSNAAGLLKEELDADGGSGFSFGDLLADRAGTAFAAHATRDEPTARALQDRIAGGFVAADFMPSASGLPEGIGDAELRTRYGGVEGALYRRHVQEIAQRIAASPGYQPAVAVTQ